MASVTYETLGVGLRAAREAASLTQQWVAMRLGVAQSLISLYERGVVRPRPARLAVYAAVLGLDLDELRTLAGYPAPPAAR
jgi:transcriptional regulator with XRE-family HTH domain